MPVLGCWDMRVPIDLHVASKSHRHDMRFCTTEHTNLFVESCGRVLGTPSFTDYFVMGSHTGRSARSTYRVSHRELAL